jgi:3-methylfumaryl-CoA hydratase
MNDRPIAAAITPEQIALAKTWEGRSERQQDQITLAPIRGLAAALDRTDLDLAMGSVLPPLWHWLLFLPQAPQSSLGADGHPRLGGFLPPIPLPRRMWAGGRIQWHAPLHLGETVHRTSTIVSVSHKAGRSGDLVFVLLRHELSRADGILAVSEEQDIVYRAPAQPGDAAPTPRAAPASAAWSRSLTPDPVLLFRYSALTFNGHRIHYDRPYATGTEGYEGLVVHGPLIATLLADLAMRERRSPGLKSFAFRAVRPLVDLHSFAVCGEPSADGTSARLWTRDQAGWLTMEAEATFA